MLVFYDRLAEERQVGFMDQPVRNYLNLCFIFLR